MSDDDLEGTSYRDLQMRCKMAGIPANLSKTEMIAAIKEVSVEDFWACEMCTFVNKPMSLTCEICTAQKSLQKFNKKKPKEALESESTNIKKRKKIESKTDENMDEQRQSEPKSKKARSRNLKINVHNRSPFCNEDGSMVVVNLESLKEESATASLDVFHASLVNFGAACMHVDQALAKLIHATLQYANAYFHMARVEDNYSQNCQESNPTTSSNKLSLDLRQRSAFDEMASVVKVLLLKTFKGQPKHLLASLLEAGESANGTEQSKEDWMGVSDQLLLGNSKLFAHQYDKGAELALQQEEGIITIVARLGGSPDLEVSGRSKTTFSSNDLASGSIDLLVLVGSKLANAIEDLQAAHYKAAGCGKSHHTLLVFQLGGSSVNVHAASPAAKVVSQKKPPSSVVSQKELPSNAAPQKEQSSNVVSQKEPSGPNESDKRMILIVRSAGGDVTFKVKKRSKFSKIFKAFSKKIGWKLGSVKFSFGEKRILPEQFPCDFSMVDQDEIAAVRQPD